MGTVRLRLFAAPSRSEWLGLAALVALALAFGVVVEIRSAFLAERRTDLPIYLQAAWAVRTGADPYAFKTERECHYNYPPLLAIALTPLAQAAPGTADRPLVPYQMAVALWYVLSLLALIAGTHALASALEENSPDPAVREQSWSRRRWWILRLVPLLVCLPGTARTLSLGQVDLLVLALLCATIAAALRRQSWRAGLWLSGAVCIKLIPAFLLLYPLRRLDVRWLAGCAVGVIVGWGLVPSLVWGPEQAWNLQRRWVEVVVLPGLGRGTDHSRESDLTNLRAVNSQSLVAVLHNLRYPERETQPVRPVPADSALALLAGAALVAVTLVRARGRRARAEAAATALGALLAIMLLLTPVCHPHYFCHWLPLVMGLLAWDMERHGNRGIGRGLLLVLALNVGANVCTSVPGLPALRNFGLATGAGLLLWAAAAVALWRWPCPRRQGPQPVSARISLTSTTSASITANIEPTTPRVAARPTPSVPPSAVMPT
jgi:alpha-1,2-mannosyltransferase